jgi:hypothetical protein
MKGNFSMEQMMTKAKTNKIQLRLADGTTVEAAAPIIISASRSTDMPAFHALALRNLLERGYTTWVNPFNRKEMHVSFERSRVFVFWSKNPKPLMPHLRAWEERGLGFYFQFTVNDYEAERWEPHVPSLAERIETFQALSEQYGKARVIWRFDPLVLTEKTPVPALLEKIERVGERLHPFTEKLVFSFADIADYDKVQRRFKQRDVVWRDFEPEDLEAAVKGIAALCRRWSLNPTTCAETGDFSGLGVAHNKCIDDDLLVRLFAHDQALMDFLGFQIQSPTLFDSPTSARKAVKLKDKGQRQACGCVVSKDIGSYNTCGHLCLYCYANGSDKVVEQNLR